MSDSVFPKVVISFGILLILSWIIAVSIERRIGGGGRSWATSEWMNKMMDMAGTLPLILGIFLLLLGLATCGK